MNFLRNELEEEEHRVLAESGFGLQVKIKIKLFQPFSNQNTSASVLTSSVENFSVKIKCLFCDFNHNNQDGRKAVAMTQEERKAAVIGKRCCLVYLKPRHVVKNCRSSVRCLICEKVHFIILCAEPAPSLKNVDTSFKKSSNTEILLSYLPNNLRRE
ncbi:uncharacterized protein NPIL_641261 [Nephila pilipes]|uniref:Uncharacterized protein n=1 Tax=Nephila pilipes TaxID=299642 RepID=A0A8X6U2I8_NEPPI|nr:uncharacterized protein NPIL_641261 [Nephila pilipes]